jgi:carboxymethylenebutenolidase
MTPEEMVAVWDAHTRAEFESKDVDAVMATVTDDVVNHNVAVDTGARGYDAVRAYYRDVFIPSLPEDWQVQSVNRVIGEDQLVEEVHITFTHSKRMDWLIPNLPPTQRRVETDQIVVVGFRDGKICGERIYWDQLGLLRQVGVLAEREEARG